MLVIPFPAPAGYKWVFTKEYIDPSNDHVVRAIDYNRTTLCLLVAIGSTIH